MKHIYQEQFKPFIQAQISAAAKEKKLTMDETAELLAIDTRTYAYVKAGTTMCSASTLLMYLAELCPDTDQFIRELRELVDRIQQEL